MMSKSVIILFSLLVSSWAFPNGGPIDACVKAIPNQPNHSGIESQPAQSNPFIVEASSSYYDSRTPITVTIYAPKNSFKGYFFQARDAQTNEWIGTFEKARDVKAYSECSAATHTNAEPKDSATLIWHPPQDRKGGQVYFVGTVLQNYKTFWSDIVADVRED